MSEASGGATLQANVALLENNARVAAEIAVANSRWELRRRQASPPDCN